MQFQSYVSLTPFDEHVCDVEAVFLPGDPSVGIDDDIDLFVSIDGVDVTYDISKDARQRLMNEATQHMQAHADEMMIDRYLDSL